MRSLISTGIKDRQKQENLNWEEIKLPVVGNVSIAFVKFVKMKCINVWSKIKKFFLIKYPERP